MKKVFSSASLGLISLLAVAQPALAQAPTFTFDRTGLPFTNLGELLRVVLLLLFVFAAVLAFVFILIGGIQWITAGGDKMAAQSARDRITAAVVGLVIVMAAFAITWIVTAALGVNIFTGGEITLPFTKGPFDK
ncbi:MAG: hypothetical protein A2126_04230 [Candidatus Woykebacteria bacterium GWB1_45_5]|uniref:Uncharacterized protein n=2 Tax=Candidatus Woykeibacteriota TaxID=1817899 RepID=A0A1G1W1J4_9BACT|nr:MAG: hypothetical protein A2113_02035 [Candidatus Woykebacteria bacterium GWA1_44_8]OGY22349.1 MAG: hypothetical protein A2126_04230 [Candidatus Woykebacteria bacterium GWB1_45_5]